MRILVIGSGGREHALCWKLAQSAEKPELYAIPGNPGIAQLAIRLPGSDYLAAALHLQPDLTVVGPEAPLAAGIVDEFRRRGWPIVGPVQAAARIETSKAFAKDAMREACIPTARFINAEGGAEALAALQGFPLPVVIKADGLAAGKGVVIAHTREEARQAVHELLAISAQLVIEEYLAGDEVSLIVLTDGRRVIPLEPAQDHKAVFDGDRGPNTGGMGVYSDARILSEEMRAAVMHTIILPALDWMRHNGHPFTGFLYAGLMITADGPQVLEFNCRLGDPETQALLYRLNSDLVPALMGIAHGQLTGSLTWKPDPSVCVVLAARGYPAKVSTGDPITGIEDVRNAVVFHAGTEQKNNVLRTSGGRVLGVTADGPALHQAIAHAYQGVEKIRFRGMHYRTDIGRKGLLRHETEA